MRQIEGKCHCGNIDYTFFLPGEMLQIPVRACSCTFCVKHGGVYTSHPNGQLDIRIAEKELVHQYAFGTKTAEFYICRRCGVVPLVTSTINGTRYAVVNVNTFENVSQSELDSSVTDFDGEEVGERLTRRERSWIPQVSVDPNFRF
ncbi:hypothetical protein KFU94_60365 [Chloroflexi bacterium TSY]|nr:hypothetical protein [Chloroflexi bacterium TSY]